MLIAFLGPLFSVRVKGAAIQWVKIQPGKLKHKETVVEGIDQAVGAFLGLFRGQNVGKMVVELA